MKIFRFLFCALILLGNATCVESMAAESVALNVARLTVLNADAAISALTDDTTCGFHSDQVTETFEGDILGQGRRILRVENCELDFEVPTITSTNCHTGVTISAYGRVLFREATITIEGLLLTNIGPVIPERSDAVTIRASVEFDHWTAGYSDNEAHMVWVSGGLSGVVRPRMARSEGGQLEIQTGNKAFWDVVYQPSQAYIASGDVTINVDIDSSNLWGAQGVHTVPERGLVENGLNGDISVWGQAFTLPNPEDPGLDPDYDAAEFVLSDECREGIEVPIDYGEEEEE